MYKFQSRFLRRGLTMAVFKSSLKSLFVSDMLNIWVMIGRQTVSMSFSVVVSIWSNSQLLFFIPIISLFTSSYVCGAKLSNLAYLFSLVDMEECPWRVVGFLWSCLERIQQSLWLFLHFSCLVVVGCQCWIPWVCELLSVFAIVFDLLGDYLPFMVF